MRSTRLSKNPIALAIGALACLPWPAAWAQSDAAANDLPAVIITGTKRPQLEQQATQSVTVLTPDELTNDLDALSAVFRLPNVAAVSAGQLPSVRGIDGSGVATGSGAAISGGRPRFTTYVDGVARGHSFNPDGVASIWDLKQIEFYRGAQSTSLGRDASAGAMVISTIDPQFRDEGAVLAGYRSARTAWFGAAMLNRALSEEFAVRLTAEGLDGTSWRNIRDVSLDGRTQEDLEAQQSLRFRIKALWNPSALPEFSLRFAYTNERDDLPNSPDLISGPDFKRREVGEIRTYSYFQTRNETTSLQAGYDLGGGWVADGIVAYQQSSNKSKPWPAFGPLALAVHADSTEISFEPKLSYLAGGGSRTSLTLGAFFFDRDRTEGGLPSTAFVYDATDSVRTYSLFGDARIQVAPAWDLLVGARLERESQRRNLSGTLLGVIPAELALDESVNAFLPKLGVEYLLAPDVSIGLVGYSGYQAPGGGVDFLGTGGSYTWAKETSNTAELYWRSQWLNRTLTVNANVFYTAYKDYQIFGSDGKGGFIVKNADDVTTRGLELEATWRPSRGLSMFAQLGLQRARVNTFDNGLNAFINGNYLPNAPKTTARIGGSVEPLAGLTLGGDVRYTASAYGDVENLAEVYVPSFTVLNLNASYKVGPVSLAAFINNVTNKFYMTSLLYPDGLLPRGYAGAPRTVGLTAQFAF